MADVILHPVHLHDLAAQWLREDAPHFDFAAAAIGETPTQARILCKSPCVLAGIPFVDALFSALQCRCQWHWVEGYDVGQCPVEVGLAGGSANNLLRAERVVLNCLARASGVATTARRLKRALEAAGWHGALAATRKTTPGFRMVEKYACLVGHADMHRYDLSSMAMIKDNHVTVAGGVTKAIEAVRKVCGFAVKIEVECSTVEQAKEAALAGCEVVMFDNLEPKDLHKAARQVKEEFPGIVVEASGGINESNILNFAGKNIDVISTSSLVQGYQTVDFSMKCC